MLDFQTRLIFPVDAVPRAGPLPAGAHELTVRTIDGETLRGVHIPAERRVKERLLILGFADAPLVFDHAIERVKPSRIIAVGFSIGSGVAATLAAQRHLDGLILVTPFDSLKAVAQGLYPWIPIGPFFAHEIDAASALANAELPVAILAAERDEIVPLERTKALRACVTKLVFDRTMARAGHNDIYARADFHEAMREAMAVLIRSG